MPCSSVSFLPSVLLSAWLGKSWVVGDSSCGACREGFAVGSPRVGGEGEGRGLVGGRESPACRVEGRDWRRDPGPAGGTSGISAWRWRWWPHGADGRSRGAAPRGSPSQAAPGGRVGTRVGKEQAERGIDGALPELFSWRNMVRVPTVSHFSQGEQHRHLHGPLGRDRGAPRNLSASPNLEPSSRSPLSRIFDSSS